MQRLSSFLSRATTVRMRPFVVVVAIATGVALLDASDWTEVRGPNRDGTSAETNLPSRWSPAGENLAWSLPFGSRSTPVIRGNRLYLLTTTDGDLSLTQERLVAVDVNSGKVLWDQKFSIYLSDVPQHRAAWSSPAIDPETGNVYVLTVGAELAAVSPEGKVIWTRSL